MGKRDYYEKGDHNAICDRCGQKFKARECDFEWNHLFVCYHCWEPRQSQDFVRGLVDEQTPPIVRSRGELRFVD